MSTESETDTDKDAGTPPPEEQGEDEGKGGKNALKADLARERDKRQQAERDAREAIEKLQKLEQASLSDQEKALAKAKEEGKLEALTTANERLIRAEVRAAAAGKLADPDDAIQLLDLSSFKVNSAGDPPVDDIRKAIIDLVKAKPYLTVAPDGPGRGSADGGPRGKGGAKQTDMNDFIRRAAGVNTA